MILISVRTNHDMCFNSAPHAAMRRRLLFVCLELKHKDEAETGRLTPASALKLSIIIINCC